MPAASSNGVPTIDFDATLKASKPKVRAKIKAFGQEFRLVRPNQMVAGQLIDHGGDINVGYVNDYLLAHVHPDDRSGFEAAAIECETLDIETLMSLMQMMTEAVYESVPSEPS